MPDYGYPSHGINTSGTVDDLLTAQAPQDSSGVSRPLVQVASADGNRIATLINPVATDWVIRRVTISNDTAGSIARLYIGQPSPLSLVSVDKYGDGDELDLINPYYIPRGTPFVCVWDNGTPSTCFMRVEFEAVQ